MSVDYRGRSTVSQGGPLTPNVATFPDAMVEGDTVIVVLAHRESDWSTNTEGGFTLVDRLNATTANMRVEVWKKIAGADESTTFGGSYTFTLPSAGSIQAVANTVAVSGAGASPQVLVSLRDNAAGATGSTSLSPNDGALVISYAMQNNTSGSAAVSNWATGAPGSLSLTERIDLISFNGSSPWFEFALATASLTSGATGESSWTGPALANVGVLVTVSVGATTEAPEASLDLNSSAACCEHVDEDGEPEATNAGPLLPVINPLWTSACAGSGTVPTASTPSDSEDWDT